MKRLRDNGLTIVLILATVATITGMVIAGYSVYNGELLQYAHAAVDFPAYLASGHFLSAVFENWESEFLQMSAYVVLTAFLFQRGSAESKDPDSPSAQDAAPEEGAANPNAPGAVRRGGAVATLYAYSLGLTLFALFLLCFVCTYATVPRRRQKRPFCMGSFRYPYGTISAALSSGSNPSRIRKVSFSRPHFSLFSQFSCGSVVRPSQNPLQRPMSRRAHRFASRPLSLKWNRTTVTAAPTSYYFLARSTAILR